ncbi:hypothetical protein LguiA_003124 [Lonicera macranthoides]
MHLALSGCCPGGAKCIYDLLVVVQVVVQVRTISSIVIACTHFKRKIPSATKFVTDSLMAKLVVAIFYPVCLSATPVVSQATLSTTTLLISLAFISVVLPYQDL